MMTGMAPLMQGAACRLYGDNVYPNIAHLYPNSVTLNPSGGAWNQIVVNPRYGIKELYEGEDLEHSDEGVFRHLMTRLDTCTIPTFYLVITVSSHTPFNLADQIDWPIDKNMPKNMRNYIKCMHYEDEQFGKLINMMERRNLFDKVDIVITGDHIIFQKLMLKEMQNYAEATNLQIKDGKNYCPLIISTSKMDCNTYCHDVAYQMDAFPTIMSAIGIKDYWWKGLGDNLFDGTRDGVFTSEWIENLSDKMIRSNYFNALNK